MFRSSARAVRVRLRRTDAGGSKLCFCLALVAIGFCAQNAGRLSLAADNQSPDSDNGESSAKFRVHADFPFAESAALLADIDRLQADLTQTLRIERGPGPIDLYLFADSAGYTRYLHERYPQVPYRRAMYVKDRARGQLFIQMGENFQIDLHHEGTHALLHDSLPRVPLWLDEGLAKYFEVPRESRASGNPYLSIVQTGARRGFIPRLDMLERMRDVGDMGPREYCSAWAWVHFMLNGPPAAHAELVRYLAEIRAYKSPGELSDRLTQQMPELNQIFLRHFAEWPVP